LLPQAIAANTPAITANAQPVVITIQPEPSAFERFKTTPATTPSPNKINTKVPINSPKNGEIITTFPLFEISIVRDYELLFYWPGTLYAAQLNDRVTAFFHSW